MAITREDLFAAFALHALLTLEPNRWRTGGPPELAAQAVEIADALDYARSEQDAEYAANPPPAVQPLVSAPLILRLTAGLGLDYLAPPPSEEDLAKALPDLLRGHESLDPQAREAFRLYVDAIIAKVQHAVKHAGRGRDLRTVEALSAIRNRLIDTEGIGYLPAANWIMDLQDALLDEREIPSLPQEEFKVDPATRRAFLKTLLDREEPTNG